MLPFERHVFVCTNRRAPEDPKGCCAAKGSEEIRDRLKARIAELGLRGRIRINAAGCLDQCARGVTVVVYPEGVWYGGVKVSDVDELVERHLRRGQPVARLEIPAHELTGKEPPPDLGNDLGKE